MSKANAAKKEKGAAFGNLGDMMGMDGMTSVLSAVSDAGRPTFAMVNRHDIKIYAQQRDKDELESEDQSLDDLGADMRKRGMIQPIVLCENEDGPEPWRLVAGERRYRGSDIAEIDDLPSMCYGKLTEQQIKDIQLAENIHRLNMSQLNEAKVLKGRLNDEFGGDVEALCEAISKSRSWVSKRLALLEMPEQTQRLVREGITADIEVINQVRTIEKIDPEAAKATVNTLKAETGKGGGKGNAREIVKAAKDQVKPPKEKKSPPPANDRQQLEEEEEQQEFSESVDTHAQELPPAHEPVRVSTAPALPPVDALDDAYGRILMEGSDPKMVLSMMPEQQRNDVTNWLRAFYDSGVSCQNIALTVMKGFRSGSFGEEGHRALALMAFLSGAEEGVTFNLQSILGSAKA
ncbi:putative chromosome-partitioning protein ParB [compost metagenome]